MGRIYIAQYGELRTTVAVSGPKASCYTSVRRGVTTLGMQDVDIATKIFSYFLHYLDYDSRR